jgi:two-component system sensor histidine kinase YesM
MKSGFLQKMRPDSIRTKMMISFFSVIILSIISVSYISFVLFKNTMTRKSTDSILNSVNQTILNIDALFEGMDSLTIPFLGNKQMQAFLSSEWSTLQDTNNFVEYVNKLARGNPYVFNIEVYSFMKDQLITSEYGMVRTPPDMNVYDWYRNALSLEGASFFQDTYEFNHYHQTEQTKHNLVSVARLIRENYFRDSLGVVNITIKESVLSDILNRIISSPQQRVLIVNKSFETISSSSFNSKTTFEPDSRIFGNNTGYFIRKTDTGQQLVVYGTLSHTEWAIVSTIPMDEVLSDVKILELYAVICSLATMLIGYIFTRTVTKSFYNPILILKESMNKASKGHFDISINEDRNDEFQELNSNFNTMVSTINTLINELYKQKIIEKDIQLKALLTNINPHFLYNIFESMIWMLELNEYDALNDMIIALSNYYRMTLSGGRDIVSISEAMEQIKNYIVIQQIRYMDSVKVVIDVEERIYHFKILKMVLQPLVENAFIHGMKNSTNATIKISGRLEEDSHIVFCVEDSGTGITQAKLDDIRKTLAKSISDTDVTSKGDYYALRNINHMIKLNYGEQYGIQIESEYGAGTRVTVRVPAETNWRENTG